MTDLRKMRNAVGGALSALWAGIRSVEDTILMVNVGSSRSGSGTFAGSNEEQFCPHREHMRQAAKLQRDEEDRRRRNWGVAAFSHSRS